MKKLIHRIVREDNFLSLSGNLIIAVLGFAGFALLARSLSSDDFASWVLFISGGSLVEMLRYGITNNGLVRFLSGASQKEKAQLIGANVIISFCITLVVAMLLAGVKYFFDEAISASSYNLFFSWYPIFALVNLPFNNAIVVQQAHIKFDRILCIKAFNSTLFFSFLMVNYFYMRLSIFEIILVFLATNTATSIICVIKSWDGLIFVKKSNIKSIKTLLNFGKHSTFTLIGTNLLKNADIWIISVSPFGSSAVALFSIPLKLTEIQQIPLRSFTATAFPKMSKASMNGKTEMVKDLFHVYAGALTYLFLGISALTFVFAEAFVILISGYQYLDSSATGINIVGIVRILSIYGILLPLDRMTGIGLDSINKPNINAFKVGVMLTTNIIGNLIAIYVFNSIELVAVTTLIFTFLGILIGFYFFKKHIAISLVGTFLKANNFYKKIWFQFRKYKREVGY